jgi:hypothetical protein
MSETPWTGDVHVTLTRVWLGLQGFVGLVFTALSPMSGWIAGTQDPEFESLGPVGGAIVIGLAGLACFGSVGFASVGASIGLGRRKTWAWWAGVLSLALLCFGACLPVGAYGIWALSRVEVRRHYGVS